MSNLIYPNRASLSEKLKGFTNIADECVDINECLLYPCGEYFDIDSDGEVISTVTCINTGFGWCIQLPTTRVRVHITFLTHPKWVGSYECGCFFKGLGYNTETQTCINTIDDYCRQGMPKPRFEPTDILVTSKEIPMKFLSWKSKLWWPSSFWHRKWNLFNKNRIGPSSFWM